MFENEDFKEILKILAKERRYDLCSLLISLFDELDDSEDADYEPILESEPPEEYMEGGSVPEGYDDEDVGMTADGFLYLKD
jgi:hypothetical protein|tara:strand:+ start:796 stop:1038 length:243 start_codon:yes stop_codon:yes gene_type:complete